MDKYYSVNLSSLSSEELLIFNDCVKRGAKEFNSLIGRILNLVPVNIPWLLSSFNSRDIHLSNMFLNYCYIMMIEELMKKRTINQIIVNNFALKVALKSYLKTRGQTIKVRFLCKPKEIVDLFLVSIKSLMNLGLFVLMALIIRNGKNLFRYDKEGKVLVDVFVIKGSFLDEGFVYSDRYYTGMEKYLSKENLDGIYFVPNFVGIGIRNLQKVRKSLMNSGKHFLFKEDFFSVFDYLVIIFRMLTIPILVIKNRDRFPRWKDLNIFILILHDAVSNIFNFSIFNGLLNYYFFFKLKKHKFKIKSVLDWNENQLVDKGFIKGARDFYPNIATKGYQGYLVSRTANIHLNPTSDEYRLGLIPDILIVPGKGLVNSINEFCSEVKVATGPALRSSDIFLLNKKLEDNRTVFSIFAPLPIGYKESNDLLVILSRLSPEIKIIVRIHPANIVHKKKYLELYPRLYFTEVSVIACLVDSDLIIGNTTSALIEAICMSKPVIVLGSSYGFTQNPIPESISNEIWTICYDIKKLEYIINDFKNKKESMKERYAEIAQSTKENFFEPVNFSNVYSMFLD